MIYNTDFEGMAVGPTTMVAINGPGGIPVGTIFGALAIIERDATWGALTFFGDRALSIVGQATIFIDGGITTFAFMVGSRTANAANPYFGFDVIMPSGPVKAVDLTPNLMGRTMQQGAFSNFGVQVVAGDYGRGKIAGDCIGQIQIGK